MLANTGAQVILRRYVVTPHSPYLTCDDRNCEDIELSENSGIEILGVATGYMHPFELDGAQPDATNFKNN